MSLGHHQCSLKCRARLSLNLGTPCSPNLRYSVLTHLRYSVLTHLRVLRAHPILKTPCSPHLRYSVLTPSSVLRAHPMLGTPCSPILGTPCSPNLRSNSFYIPCRDSVLTLHLRQFKVLQLRVLGTPTLCPRYSNPVS